LSKTQKILLDFISLQVNEEGKFNGGGEYAKIIFDELLLKYEKIKFYALVDLSIPMNEFVEYYLTKYSLRVFDINNNSLASIVEENKITTVYSPLPYRFSDVKLNNTRFIGTIHGLRDLELIDSRTRILYTSNYLEKIKIYVKILFPNIGNRKKINYYNKLINQNKFEFITVSNHSKYSILSYLNYNRPENIKVYYSPNTTNILKTYSPIEHLFSDLESQKFFLLVSGNRWIKNNARAILALDELFDSKDIGSFKVVVTGCKGKLPFVKKIKHKKQFIFLDYVTSIELSHLYKNCYSLIYPSLNEGFGYPPVEAMYFNKPVLSSPNTSISEICGEAALYFNPLSVKEIKSRILMILEKKVYDLQVKKCQAKYKEIREIQDADLQSLVSHIIKE